MTTLFRKILAPHDFSTAATAALETAVTLAIRHRGSLTVLHALPPVYSFSVFAGGGDVPSWMPPKELVSEAHVKLEAAVARTLGKRRVRVTCKVLVGDPADCILAAARQADSIVMSTLGRSGIAHLLIGSVAEKVVRHARVPVLTIRAAGRARGARRGAAG